MMKNNNENLDQSKRSDVAVKVISIVILQVAVLVHALAGVFSKFASGNEFWSWAYWIPFGISLACTFAYALLWQLTLKRISLITAFLGKSLGTAWMALFGYLFCFLLI